MKFLMPAALDAAGAFCATVSGTCMEPDFLDRAIVVFPPSSVAAIQDGKAYCVQLKDRRWGFKQLWRVPGRPDVLRVWCVNHSVHATPWEMLVADVASVAVFTAVGRKDAA